MNKEDKKKMLNEYKKRERENFEKSLPMTRDLLGDLFDYLDENLEENGAGCDCEVLFNIEENFED